MRRPITPRETVANALLEMDALLLAHPDKIDETVREALAEKIETALEVSTSFAQEAPAMDPAKLDMFAEESGPERLESFVRKYLEKQVSTLRFEDVDEADLVRSMLREIRKSSPNEDVGYSLQRASHRVVENVTGVLDNQAENIETLMREAVGLDGRVPDRDTDAAESESAARKVLDTLAPSKTLAPRDETPEP